MENNTNYRPKSKKFIDELNNRQPNAKIASANRDLESLMAMRDRRAQKYGITISESFIDLAGAFKPVATTYRDDRFFVTHEKLTMGHTIKFKKNNREIYSHESERVYTQADVIDLLDSTRLPSGAYVCPNCGDISSAEELSSTGCPYCGTRFSIPELYPKVSHFSYSEGQTNLKKSLYKKCIKPVVITFLVSYFIFFSRGCAEVLDNNGSFGSIMLLGFVMIFAALFPAFIAFGITAYVQSLKTGLSDSYQRSKSHAAERETQFSTRVFEKTMAEYGPIFNFNYFSSRVYNLLGAMIYAEKSDECPFYNGPDFVGGFDMIIDYVPTGMEILDFNISDEGICSIDTKVLAITYSYVNGKIHHRQTEFRVKASKNMNYPIDINFSAHTYCCDGCSASFDATKVKSCPYCGRPHDMLDEEWFIDGKVVGTFK